MFLVDNNLSPKIAKFLKTAFPDSCHVADIGMATADDQTVWAYAKAKSFHILSKDRDFVALLHLQGFPPKVVRLSSGNVPTKHIIALLQRNLSVLREFLNSQKHGLLILQ